MRVRAILSAVLSRGIRTIFSHYEKIKKPGRERCSTCGVRHSLPDVEGGFQPPGKNVNILMSHKSSAALRLRDVFFPPGLEARLYGSQGWPPPRSLRPRLRSGGTPQRGIPTKTESQQLCPPKTHSRHCTYVRLLSFLQSNSLVRKMPAGVYQRNPKRGQSCPRSVWEKTLSFQRSVKRPTLARLTARSKK